MPREIVISARNYASLSGPAGLSALGSARLADVVPDLSGPPVIADEVRQTLYGDDDGDGDDGMCAIAMS